MDRGMAERSIAIFVSSTVLTQLLLTGVAAWLGKRVAKHRRATIYLGLLAVCSMFMVSAAVAEDNGLHVELNKLEDVGGACRAYLVFENAMDADFSAFKIDFVMFDGNGVVAKRLAVDVAPLRPGKTILKVFDIPGLACENTGRILINGVIECRSGERQRRDCVAFVIPASRADTKLVK